MAIKSGLGPLESRFEPSWGSWRLSEGSRRHLGALLKALGALLECFKRGEGEQGELRESSRRDQAAAPGRDKGGLNPSLEVSKYQKDQVIERLKG